MANTERQTQTGDVTKLKPPSKYNVICLNDDVTPMDFVVDCLMSIFKKSYEEAHDITMTIHNTGRGIAGTYSYEVAEQKCVEAVTRARGAGYPLDLILEEVD